MEKYKIIEDSKTKKFTAKDMNFIFNKSTGFTAVWGKTLKQDPEYSIHGPLIADIEITTACNGPGGVPCKYCYKSNNKTGTYMSIETFKKVFHNLPKTITQIAFGADSDLTTNPDIWKIMEYCRSNDYNFVVPNVTLAEVTDENSKHLSDLCGAVAISFHDDFDLCYDSVKKLTDLGMDQVNIHFVLHEKSYEDCLKMIEDIKTDSRLSKLNAVVFLSLKQKGRGINFSKLSVDKFDEIVYKCMQDKIRFGLDSCSANKLINSIKNHENYEKIVQMVEPCESTLFSSYIDVHGKFYPCSFCEKIDGWKEGIDVVNCEDFIKDIWNNDKTIQFRNNLLKCNRNCPVYNV